MLIIILTLVALLCVATLAAIYFWALGKELRVAAAEKIAQLHKEKYDIGQAWEQGMDEQQESYEMQLLTLQERYNDLEGENAALQSVVVQHEEWCLPTLKSPFR